MIVKRRPMPLCFHRYCQIRHTATFWMVMPQCKMVILFKEHWFQRSPSATQHKCHFCWISFGTRQPITTWLGAVWDEPLSEKASTWHLAHCICQSTICTLFVSVLNHIWQVWHLCSCALRQCRSAAIWSMSSYRLEFQRLFPASSEWIISLWWALTFTKSQ